MTSVMKDKFGELNMTQDEINRFTEAMKKEEFRKLLIEYAQEISDPKNREIYEQEIVKLEQERGMDAIFIYPEPGYCIITSQDRKKKCFINICKNSNIQKPSSKRDCNNNKEGLYWNIPHSCSSAREDFDKSTNEICAVYDVVFHPDTYRMGETSQRFNDFLKDSAMDTIEKNFNVKLDKANSKILKNINFKGKPTACIIKRPINGKGLNTEQKITSDQNPIEKIINSLKVEYLKDQTQKKNKNQLNYQDDSVKFIKPIYKIIYTGQTDIQDCVMFSKNIVENTRPKDIKISIELPLCKSSSDITLDIFEKRLYLESKNPFYKLDLNLSYPVNEKEAKAKFDKSKKILTVILPVISFTSLINDKFDQPTEEKLESVSKPCLLSSSLSSLKETEKAIIQDVKYLIPSDYRIVHYDDFLKISIYEDNYNKDSIKIQAISQNTLALFFECISQSGTYITYYKAYFNFFQNDNAYLFGYSDFQQFLGSIKITPLKNIFEIDIPNNNDDHNAALTCFISSEMVQFNKINDADSKSFEIYEVKKEQNKKEAFDSESFLPTSHINEEFYENISKNVEQTDSDDESALDIQTKMREEKKNLTDFNISSDKQDENCYSNSSINSSGLKSILKKNRSISEGEGSVRSSIESNSNDGSQELCSMKKSVSFSKQVVRNIFKPGSTITGMKKPNSSKNRKKNQKRNRTLSDPCHSHDQMTNDLIQHQVIFRQRGFSESSDDLINSSECISKMELLSNNQIKRNKKCEKKNSIKSEEKISEKDEFDLKKMIELKNDGGMETNKEFGKKTSCAFKLRNKIVDELD